MLHYFRSVSLGNADDAIQLFEDIVAGRKVNGDRTSEYPDTLPEAVEALLEEIRRPMRVEDILDELNKRYPGRTRAAPLRSSLSRRTLVRRGTLTRLDHGTYGLRTWPDHVKRLVRP